MTITTVNAPGNPPDWHELASRLGMFGADGERGGDDYGRQALAEWLGPQALRDTVDFYVDGNPGRALARSVLHVLRADVAAQRCLEIYETDSDPYRKAAAVELLRAVASERHLPRVADFLRDPDPSVQNWGMGVLESVCDRATVAAEVIEPYLAEAESHANSDVARLARGLRRHLAGQ